MTRNTGNQPGPRPDEAHCVRVTIAIPGQAKRRQTMFVSDRLPDLKLATNNAKELGLEVEITWDVVQLSEEDPNAVVCALLDSAASAYGLMLGAPVDPMKSRMNELERDTRENRRAIAGMVASVDKLVAMIAQRPIIAAPVQPRAIVTQPVDEIIEPMAEDEVPRSIGQARAPDGRAIEVSAIRQGEPRDTRRRRGETRAEAATPDMNLIGAVPKSDMFFVDGEGEIEVVKLPTVGDSLKSMSWLSDIPAAKK